MDIAELDIERRDRVTHGDYIVKLDENDSVARLSWTDRSGIRHAEHTFVPAEHRGKGIAAELVKALVADARRQDFKIAPDCSYVASYFRRHKDLAELRA